MNEMVEGIEARFIYEEEKKGFVKRDGRTMLCWNFDFICNEIIKLKVEDKGLFGWITSAFVLG